jgi:hypothetical protein
MGKKSIANLRKNAALESSKNSAVTNLDSPVEQDQNAPNEGVSHLEESSNPTEDVQEGSKRKRVRKRKASAIGHTDDDLAEGNVEKKESVPVEAVESNR